jgi:hypothetical protein
MDSASGKDIIAQTLEDAVRYALTVKATETIDKVLAGVRTDLIKGVTTAMVDLGASVNISQQECKLCMEITLPFSDLRAAVARSEK